MNALQYGQSNLTAATNALSVLTGTAPRTSPMSPMSFLVTPAQQAQNQVLTNTNGQATGQAGANASTAAGNYNSQNLWDQTTSSLSSIQNNPQLLSQISKLFSGGGNSGGVDGSIVNGISNY